ANIDGDLAIQRSLSKCHSCEGQFSEPNKCSWHLFKNLPRLSVSHLLEARGYPPSLETIDEQITSGMRDLG
ncbi:MAG: hypothetical protein ABI268_01030, partial [Rhodanobacter sp.]